MKPFAINSNPITRALAVAAFSLTVAVQSQTASAYDFCQIVSDRVSAALTSAKSSAMNSNIDLGDGVFKVVVSGYINSFIQANGKDYDDALIEANEEYVYQSCVESVPTILQPSTSTTTKGGK